LEGRGRKLKEITGAGTCRRKTIIDEYCCHGRDDKVVEGLAKDEERGGKERRYRGGKRNQAFSH